jgi:hypothetical protein
MCGEDIRRSMNVIGIGMVVNSQLPSTPRMASTLKELGHPLKELGHPLKEVGHTLKEMGHTLKEVGHILMELGRIYRGVSLGFGSMNIGSAKPYRFCTIV